ncbi:MAG TPA: C40 family peptidase [Steroidobacteraceae bacterium]|nr:C40 family peptidase [Steroidobacteraceae bacterium]
MRVVAALALSIVLAACAGTPPRPERAPPPATLGARAASLASEQIGTPYRSGGSAPGGFDCSGLVVYVYRELGVALPRTAAEQRAALGRVPLEALAPGDLVFFSTPEEHVGIYLGGGEFVHAPGSGRRVERARLDAPYFILAYAGGGRVAGP